MFNPRSEQFRALASNSEKPSSVADTQQIVNALQAINTTLRTMHGDTISALKTLQAEVRVVSAEVKSVAAEVSQMRAELKQRLEPMAHAAVNANLST